MSEYAGNVVAFPDRAGAGVGKSAIPGALYSAAERLEALSGCLLEISPQPGWSAQRWMIASTSFRMRLDDARSSLAVLAESVRVADLGAGWWTSEVRYARLDAERVLCDISACLVTLQDGDISAEQRHRAGRGFTLGKRDALKMVQTIRILVAQGGPRPCGAHEREPLPEKRQKMVNDKKFSAGGLCRPAVPGRVDPCSQLNYELRECAERLRLLVAAYEGNPSALDGDTLYRPEGAENAETAVTDIYRIMKEKVFSESSPLQAERNLWEVFRQQEEEFVSFYETAVMALEVYAEVLRVYRQLCLDTRLQPQHGELERICEDSYVHVQERRKCIEAVRNFWAKFSAMLTVLSVPG